MGTVKWLFAAWVLLALTGVVVCLPKELISKFNATEQIIYLSCAAVGVLAALFYGLNYRVLSRSDHFFALKSLFPAICPNLYSLVVLVAAKENTNSFIFVLAAASLFAVGITVYGWIKCSPKMYLIALFLTGGTATILHLWIVLHWPVSAPGDACNSSLAIFISVIVFALPGLWAALACLLATLLDASPHGGDVPLARFAERTPDATIKGKSSNPLV